MAEEIENAQPVNKHYLDKVMELSEEKDILATEDIYNSKGMKLIAKGGKISPAVHEKLIVHKLSKPLEACIAVEGGVDIEKIVAEARRLAAQNEAVGCILTATGGRVSPFDVLGSVPLGNVMSLMLTLIERGGPTAITHCAMVSLISTCIAQKLGLGEKVESTVAIGGLVHDIGELYIQPEYLNAKRALLPHEWVHVVVHPRVGRMLIEQHGSYMPDVARAVAEHHERFDGAGYPSQSSGKNISIGGQILAVAEMISGVLMKQDRPLERADLAMKIMPGEHAHFLISLISTIARVPHSMSSSSADMNHAALIGRTKSLNDRLSEVKRIGASLETAPTIKSIKAKEMLAHTLRRIAIVQRAFVSTGLDYYLTEEHIDEEEILFEIDVATREIQWRLRDVGRELFIHATGLDKSEAAILLPLINSLDGSS